MIHSSPETNRYMYSHKRIFNNHLANQLIGFIRRVKQHYRKPIYFEDIYNNNKGFLQGFTNSDIEKGLRQLVDQGRLITIEVDGRTQYQAVEGVLNNGNTNNRHVNNNKFHTTNTNNTANNHTNTTKNAQDEV